jgi:hypothetical protein
MQGQQRFFDEKRGQKGTRRAARARCQDDGQLVRTVPVRSAAVRAIQARDEACDFAERMDLARTLVAGVRRARIDEPVRRWRTRWRE